MERTHTSSNEARINVKVKGPMAAHLHQLIGTNGLYENQSEYIRDLIRHDMVQHEPYDLETSLLKGYAELADGNYKNRPMADIIAEAEQELEDENNS